MTVRIVMSWIVAPHDVGAVLLVGSLTGEDRIASAASPLAEVCVAVVHQPLLPEPVHPVAAALQHRTPLAIQIRVLAGIIVRVLHLGIDAALARGLPIAGVQGLEVNG